MGARHAQPTEPPSGSSSPVPAAVYVDELYAACCLYAGSEPAGEALLRSVLPNLVKCSPETTRVTLHRLTYRAAIGIEDDTFEPRRGPAGVDLRRAMTALPLPSRAAIFLVDAAGMHYREIADVLDTDTDGVAQLVASGRQQLRTMVDVEVDRPTR